MGEAFVTFRASSVILSLFLLAVLVIGIIFFTDIYPGESRVITPRIEPAVDGQEAVPVNSSFLFQDGEATIAVMVNGSVLEGARNADKSVTVFGNISNETAIADSYLAMIEDPAQEEIYRDIISQFRQIRKTLDLDSDEYLELMAVYVQSLNYETVDHNPAKFPVETVADGAGDCDDKSLLLAGLLSREGYSVVLLSFVPENHMALGIGSDDYRYRQTNYTFLETTNLSYVGVPTEKLGSDMTLNSMPLIIPVGGGTVTYKSAAQTRYIHEVKDLSEKRARELEGEVILVHADLEQRQNEIDAMEERMQDLKRPENIRGYNALVGPHNEKVSEYNALLESYRQEYSRYTAYVNVHNYIIDHPYDRFGVYEYIKTKLPA